MFWRWPKWHALASCGFQVHWLYLSRDADTQAPFSRVSWDDRLGAAGMVQPRFFMCMEQPNSNHSHVFSYLCTMMNDAWKVQMPVSTSIILWNGIQFADLLDLWLLIHKDLWSIVPWSRLESSIRSVCPSGFSGFSHLHWLHWASWSLWTRNQARDESSQPRTSARRSTQNQLDMIIDLLGSPDSKDDHRIFVG